MDVTPIPIPTPTPQKSTGNCFFLLCFENTFVFHTGIEPQAWYLLGKYSSIEP